MTPTDVAIVGSGVNGLVAGALLARRGLHVTVFEQADKPGGAAVTEQLTLPGFHHDTMASWIGTFVNGPAFPLLCEDLVDRGFEWAASTSWVTATASDDGRVTMLHRDPTRTTAAWHPTDARTYHDALARAAELGPPLQSLLSGGRPRWREVRAVVRLGRDRGVAATARDLLSSGSAWTARSFSGDEADRLVAPWLLHAGLGPTAAGGGLAGAMLLAGLHRTGMPVAVGGVARLVDALVDVIRGHGGSVLTGARVERLVVRSRRVVALEVAGTRVSVRRAALAGVHSTALVSDLLGTSAPASLRAGARAMRPGRAAMQVHLAVREPLPWAEPALRGTPLVHLADESPGVALSIAEAEAGLVPRRPVLAVGQQCLLDPTRAPEGAATVWLQMPAVPRHPVGDAAGAVDGVNGWDTAATVVLERVLDRLERHAPGTRSLVLASHVITPPELERRNPNLLGGDAYGGATELDQLLRLRPFPEMARLRRHVRNLWHIGASSPGGPGLGAASGVAAAEAILRRSSSRRFFSNSSAW